MIVRRLYDAVESASQAIAPRQAQRSGHSGRIKHPVGLRDTLRSALTRQWPAEAYVPASRSGKRSVGPLTWDEFVSFFQFGSLPMRQTISDTSIDIDGGFASLVAQGYEGNSIVFATMLTKLSLFAQARFMWQQLRNGQPGDLFGSADLAILEKPRLGAVTGDLLSRALVHADFAGNAFVVRKRSDRLWQPRPDWVTMIFGSFDDPSTSLVDLDADFLGIVYHPGGRHSGRDPVTYLNPNDPRLPNQVAHWAPYPDPLNPFTGTSWLIPAIREMQGDTLATRHKVKFFENGATPNVIVTVNLEDPEEFSRWVEAFDTEHKGVTNAYKTLYLMAGTQVDVKGSDFQQMDFKATQGAGETRLINAAGMHAVIVGASEGLQGSALNAGNFNAAKRLVSDKTLRYLWGNLAGSLETIIPPPQSGSRLWYDETHIPFLQEDVQDAAKVLALQAAAMRQLADGGWVPDSVVDAVTSGDLRRLQHSDLFSVQLQPPGTITASTNGTSPNGNGSSNGAGAQRSLEELVTLVKEDR